MKRFLLILTVVFSLPVVAQPITVNTNAYSVPQLVNSVLINSPCVQANNITWSTGSNFGSSNGIGYFQNTNPNFPMYAGVVLTTGSAIHAAGPNTSMLSDGSSNWPGDTSLEATLAQAGITMSSTNATVLEFDFTPISPQFNFDFVFASEEYGNFQCQFSDAFAFLLTNMNTGVTTNLALVPNTNTPISVVTIRDFLYNSSCASANAQYFGSFNGGSAAAGSATNFNGQTVLLNAASTLVPNTPYHIKLVIADRTDYESDSAIFIASDSFNIGQQVLGLDMTVASGTAVCYGQSHTLDTGLPAANYTFSWTKGGSPIAGNGPAINVTEPGTYAVTYANISNVCQATTDSITIEYYPQIITQNPTTLYKCDTGAASYSFNLALNTPVVSAGLPAGTQVSYFASQANANDNISPLPANYTVPGDTTVYVRIQNPTTGCHTVKSFLLDITNGPVANAPQDITVCEVSATQHAGIVNVATLTSQVLGSQPAAINIVSYHHSQAEANAGTNPITALLSVIDNQIIYVRVQNVTDPTCYVTTSFAVHLMPFPVVDQMQPVVVCESYTLPPLDNGNYFSGINGTGTALFAGDEITETQTVYIFNQPGGPGSCSAQSFFLVRILDPETMSPSDGTYCGSYSVPSAELGAFFSQPGGQGDPIPAGTTISTSQTLYFYFTTEIEPFCVIDTDFDVTIIPQVAVADYDNVFDCTSYTLPAIGSGNYFTGPNGTGDQLTAGTVITATQTVYAYAQSNTSPVNCTSQESFVVQIGLDAPADVSQCDPYTLPALPVGNYYTEAAGAGTMIPAGTVISTPQTIYVYAGANDCMPDRHFTISVSQPAIDTVGNQTVCGGYVLPAITNGNYFTGPNGTGTALQAGDFVGTTQTIYIYKQLNALCSNQNSFTVTVNPAPAIDSRSNIDVCNSYTLTTLDVGNYFTGPNGTGTQLAAGTVITESQVLYIYATNPNPPFCTAENSFEINIFSIEADSFPAATACDSFVLPALSDGNQYYKFSGGPAANTENDILMPGDVITQSGTIFIYKESGERINCTDENSFQITINQTPAIGNIPNANACNSYVLPALTIGDYYTGSLKTGTLLHAGDTISTSQTIYVYAETGTTPNCYDEKPLQITIFNVDELAAVTTCDSFTLPALTVGGYYTGPGGTGTHLYAGNQVSQSGTIYIYAQSPFTPTCSDESSFVLTIVDQPVANPVPAAIATTCDEDGTNDGITAFELTALSATVLGSQSGSEFVATYHESMADATAGTNAVTTSQLPVVFVRVRNTLTADCFAVRAISLHVNVLPEPTPEGGIVCFDSETETLLNPFTITSGLSASTHTFQWLNEAGEIVGTGSSYVAVVPGDYTVIAVSNATGCVSMPVTVTVEGSEPAVVSYTTSDNFSDNMTVTVTAVGTGDYEYLLDNGIWQDSNVFENVSSGIHTVTVRDKNGCGSASASALVVNYPHYFTPNADGVHDTWNIVDLHDQLNSDITIFDRYGKLITKIKPSGSGWDGTYNGKPMPSTDYWFSVNYTEDGESKEFRAHFSMKR
ncbi:MAG: T9SS type B sorting domain-containing protein [Flavobacterium sp.]|uniref:T9SS type B sorting domain-containing protein n=1 Tax=Flavobacterium sp. TaxID=239 RepID=UPI00121F8E97|nr:choice-of-anchor L domain-containing protein [Flavobacterium sp.]RZJ67112.1 MAG: T9SS type B sorting domain-containing protein [Flavobacterium sp.]